MELSFLFIVILKSADQVVTNKKIDEWPLQCNATR